MSVMISSCLALASPGGSALSTPLTMMNLLGGLMLAAGCALLASRSSRQRSTFPQFLQNITIHSPVTAGNPYLPENISSIVQITTPEEEAPAEEEPTENVVSSYMPQHK